MVTLKRKSYPIEVVLWSIALPGFGQLLNGKILKGLLFISLEFLININSNLNLNIKYSFIGEFEKAIDVTNDEWALFYPCVFVFAAFDSYIDALKIIGEEPPSYVSLPFVTSAYMATIGTIYGDTKALYQVIPPIFIPIIAAFIGFILGIFIRKLVMRIGYRVE